MIESVKDRVLLESFPDDARGTRILHAQRSIVLTDEYQNEPSRLARVVAAPKDSDVTIGDTVLCNRYPTSAWSFEHEGRELVSVKEEEILAKIELQ